MGEWLSPTELGGELLSESEFLRWSRIHGLLELGMKRICVGVLWMLLASGAIGVGLNLVRREPLPWVYDSRARTHLGAAVPEGDGVSLLAPESVTVEVLRAMAKDEVVVIDARSALFYRRGHIPGALHIDRRFLEREFAYKGARLRELRGRRFIVYCSDANCEDSRVVARELMRLGIRSVGVLEGGWRAWRDAGLGEEKG